MVFCPCGLLSGVGIFSGLLSGGFLSDGLLSGIRIQRVHANKSQLKTLEKMERRRVQGLPKFFEYPLLSQERIKLRTSNLASIFTGSMRTKAL